jgi:hypothetical protein
MWECSTHGPDVKRRTNSDRKTGKENEGYSLLRCDAVQSFTDISEEHSASIIRIEEYDNQVTKAVGLAVAQAVSRRHPSVAARVPSQVRSCVICDGRSVTGAGVLRLLRFPLPIYIPPTASHLSSIIRGRYKSPSSGRNSKWAQSHPTRRNYNKRSSYFCNRPWRPIGL